MNKPASTLESIWPTVVTTSNLVRLTAPPLSRPSDHALNALAHVGGRRQWENRPTGGRRDACIWCGAVGHDETQCYSKDPANLLLHPPRGGCLDGAVPDHMRAKDKAPKPKNTLTNVPHRERHPPERQHAHHAIIIMIRINCLGVISMSGYENKLPCSFGMSMEEFDPRWGQF
jgi:hypothetical protein